MKILADIHGYPPDHNAGAEWMVHHMFKWLKERGHEIKVMVPETSVKEFEGIEISERYENVHFRRKYLWADIIVGHLDFVGKVINNSKITNKPALFIMHNTHRYSTIAKIAHRSILCFNSKYTKAVPHYPYKESVIVHPPCPVDYYKTNRGGAKYVTIINHCKEKGAEMFFTLAKMLPDVQFLAVRGDYYFQMKEWEGKRLKNVTFKENTPRIQKEYALTKILLMPSGYESFGRTAIEAAASGIPTIAAPTPGLKESLGKAGIFCPLDDPKAWADEIKKLLKDEEYYKKKATAVRKRAKELEEGFDEQMEGLVKLMHKAVSGKLKEGRK